MERELIALIYSAILREIPWRDFLDYIAKNIPDGKAALIAHDFDRIEGYSIFNRFAAQANSAYNAFYGKLNPLQPRLVSKPIGVGVRDHELLMRADLVTTEFYNDFMIPSGMAFSAGVRLASVGSQSFSLVIGSTLDEHVDRSVNILSCAAPHLVRALNYSRNEAVRRGPNGLDIPSLIGGVDLCAIVIGGDRRVRTLSEAATSLVEQGTIVRLSIDGRIRFPKDSIQSAFEQMLVWGYDGPATVDFHTRRFRVSLVRVDVGPERLYFEGVSIIVLFEPRNAKEPPDPVQQFIQANKLSPGERRALSGILDGKTAAQVADEASLSRETIRSQIKSLYMKSGASSEADVLRLIYQTSRTRSWSM